MALSKIQLTNFRNFQQSYINFSPDFNLFYGDNAAGKTSIIEAIHFLFRGKSFNLIKNSNEIINTNCISNEFILYAEIDDNNIPTKIGLKKHKSENIYVKINEQKIFNNFSLTKIIATQIINPRSFNLIDCSPSGRRKFIDWLMFHVKHHLITDWKNYSKLIKFRNKSLKNKLPINEINIWDKQISSYFEKFNILRLNLLDEINTIFIKHSQNFFNDINIKLSYKSPWIISDSNSYSSSLVNNLSKDIKYGYTSVSLNNCDFDVDIHSIDNNKLNSKSYLSNGYKKIISYLLVFSQMEVFYNYTNKKPLLLIDDYFSELDNDTAYKLLDILYELPFQLCITCVTNHYKSIIQENRFIHLLSSKQNKVFHVKQDKIVQEELMDE